MSACSYFSAVEDVEYMTRFYVIYFVFAALVALNRAAICIMYPMRELFYCFRLNGSKVVSAEYLQPLGPEFTKKPGYDGYKDDVMTPMEKLTKMRTLPIKSCSEPRALELIVPLAQFFINWCIFYDDFYAAFGAGMGLIHSAGSGLPYLGAGWASDPLPEIAALAPLHTPALLTELFLPRLLLYVCYPANAMWQMAFSSEWYISIHLAS